VRVAAHSNRGALLLGPSQDGGPWIGILSAHVCTLLKLSPADY
jgi:hypothetical protein